MKPVRSSTSRPRSPRPAVRRRSNEPVRFNNVRCLRATDRAIYLLIPAVPGRRAEWRGWIPQSQIHDDSEVWRAGDTGQLVLTRWIAEQKGFVFRPG
jgi:hypothetical protein